MERYEHEKGRFCSSSRSILEPIPLDLATLTRLPAKFLVNTHQQRKLFCRVESRVRLGAVRDRKEDVESDKSPYKLDLLPLDIEVETLIRLPGKSLMNFQCVSKIWSSIIRSQSFVDSYYAMSSATGSRFIIAFTNSVPAEVDAQRLFIFSSSHEGEETSSLVANLDMTIPSVTLAHGSKCTSVHGFVGCCYGLQFTVCNPSTGKVITFPCNGARTSLGYDPVDDQFKALTLVSSPEQYHSFLVHEVITVGGGGVVSRSEITSSPYYPITKGICIGGFVYYGAWAPILRTTPVFVCFDVRNERLSFITTPKDVLVWECDTVLIEYKGKLAAIVRYPFAPFHRFDLWILEDVKKHDWSKQTFELPFSPGMGRDMTSQGTNKAGEIIFSPTTLPYHVEPFYIFYYNPDRKDMRRVRIHGIADTEEFRRRYALTHFCCVSVSPQHVESVAAL
uniref:F-box protein n=1 Tax=Noccaea caerulescens TaxID=107243 RepID=A0A1J3IRG2_NOCCA